MRKNGAEKEPRPNKKKKVERDSRIKMKRESWKGYAITYFVLLVLSAGQAMIYSAYMNPLFEAYNLLSMNYAELSSLITFPSHTPVEYILGMLGYWAIVSAIYASITHSQIRKAYDEPVQRMSQAAMEVASGDFSVYLEPMHTPDKYDYMDVMFEDFNRMVEELGSIETLKNDFIANVSHEIKTPLSVIQSYASALKKDSLTPEQRAEYADTVINASKNLTALVTNILRLNKLENQEITQDPEPYDLCRQLSDCALSFETEWERKNITLAVEMDDRAMICADRGMMEIVWHNLLSNALKFTRPGGTVTLTQTSEPDLITVSVADTGCGMSPEIMKRIFDKFYQGDSSHSGEGNGLGLALALRVLELSDGEITVESEPGVGSVFTVHLKPAE